MRLLQPRLLRMRVPSCDVIFEDGWWDPQGEGRGGGSLFVVS